MKSNLHTNIKMIYFHLWHVLFTMVDGRHWVQQLCDLKIYKCTFRTYARNRDWAVSGSAGGTVCVQCVIEAYRCIEQKDCLGNTTDCDLEDIPGTVSLSTEQISHHIMCNSFAIETQLQIHSKPSHLSLL